MVDIFPGLQDAVIYQLMQNCILCHHTWWIQWKQNARGKRSEDMRVLLRKRLTLYLCISLTEEITHCNSFQDRKLAECLLHSTI